MLNNYFSFFTVEQQGLSQVAMMNDSKDGLKRLVSSQQFCNLSDALHSVSEKDSSNENNNSQEQVPKRSVESRNAQVKIEAHGSTAHNSQKQVSQNRSTVAKVKKEALSRTAHNSHARVKVKLEPRTQSDSSEPRRQGSQGSVTSDPLDIDRPSTSTASLMLDSQPSTSTASTEVFSPSTDTRDKDVDENFDEDVADEPFAEEDDQVNEYRYIQYSSDEDDEVQVVAKRSKRTETGKSPIKRPKTKQLTLAAYNFTKSVYKKNGKAFMEKIPRTAECGNHKCPMKGCLKDCLSRTALRQHIRFLHPKLYEVIVKTDTPENFWKTRVNYPLEKVPSKKREQKPRSLVQYFSDDEYDEDEDVAAARAFAAGRGPCEGEGKVKGKGKGKSNAARDNLDNDDDEDLATAADLAAAAASYNAGRVAGDNDEDAAAGDNDEDWTVEEAQEAQVPKKKATDRRKGAIKRKQYPLHVKVKLIEHWDEDFREHKGKHANAAKKFKIHRSMVWKWLGAREKIFAEAARKSVNALFKIRPSAQYKHQALFHQLNMDFEDARRKGYKIDHNWLWVRAIKIKRMQEQDDEATIGSWCVAAFVKMFRIRSRAKQRTKNVSKEASIPHLTAFHGRMRAQLIRVGYNDRYHPKWGRFLPEERWNVDQSPLPFVINSKRTYETENARGNRDHKVWIAQPGNGLEKRQASLQICIRADGTPARLAIIFRGQGNITKVERQAYHKKVDVFFQVRFSLFLTPLKQLTFVKKLPF